MKKEKLRDLSGKPGVGHAPRPENRLHKKLKKTLDKQTMMCYNKVVA